MATLAQWISGARPQTLPAALAPVAVGTGAAAAMQAAHPLRAVLALLVAMALQIGVNYANDYSDGIRGTDDVRVGPFRLTGSKAARPGAVLAAAIGAFAVAVVFGSWLIFLCQKWWLFPIGAACIPAAWWYSGGRAPYGYRGWGEAFVFLFFGLVAVLGTTYSQAGALSRLALYGAVGVGALACAILIANNLRDIAGDATAGKRTLAVRLGAARTRVLYAALCGLALLMVACIAARHAWAWLTVLTLPLFVTPLRMVLGGDSGKALLPVVRDTGRIELAYGLLLGLSLAL